MSKPGVFLAIAMISAGGYVGPAVAQTSPCAGEGRIESFVTSTIVFQPKFPVRPDLTNPGARALALGGAFSATADDATASISNPAGLSSIVRPQTQLEIRPRQYAQTDTLSPATEVVLGASGTLERRGDREMGLPLFAGVVVPFADTFAVGVTVQRLYAKDTTIDRTTTPEGQLPCFRTTAFNDAIEVYKRIPLYKFDEDTDVSRAAVSVSWRPAPRFAVGATAFVARASLSTKTTLRLVGGFEVPVLEENSSTKAGLIAGALYTPVERLRIGITYASPVRFDGENRAFRSDLPITAGNSPLLFAPVLLPSRVTLGVNVGVLSNLTLSVDAVRVGWSGLEVNPSVQEREIGTYAVGNGLEVKGGLEWTLAETRTRRVDVRLGAFYEKIPGIELLAVPRGSLANDTLKETQDLAKIFSPPDADLDLVHVTGGIGVYLNKKMQVDLGVDYEIEFGAISGSLLLGYSF